MTNDSDAKSTSGLGAVPLKFVVIAVSVFLAFMLVVVIFVEYTGSDLNRRGMSVSLFVPTAEELSDGDEYYSILSGLTDKTSEVCPLVGCNQAYEGDRVTLVRFDTKKQATVYTALLAGEAYQSDWIVAHFTDPTITDEHRMRLAGSLDGAWASDDL
ncbi:MAG: hypothetical protein GX678_04310 [Actinomycetales bacterium]|nr:hypothetical protein [Actinomycetales bacterium]